MQKSETVIITGGTGTIGSHLTALLQAGGYEVRHIGRTASNEPVRRYVWDYKRGYIEPEALEGVHHIIHLAGADIAAKRWTKQRKQVLMDSRVKTALLLYEQLNSGVHNVRTFISAGGISYGNRDDTWLTEEEPFSNTFDGQICREWEAAAGKIADLGIRTVVLRTAPILAKGAGILQKLDLPVKFGIAPFFGNGKQYYSWIHVDDLCRLYLEAIESNSYQGAYNAVAPNPVPNREFVKQIALGKGARAVLLPVPAFGLRLGLGEIANTILQSTRVSCRKLMDAGFRYQFDSVEDSVNDLYYG